jgi:hypothetical protein
VEIAEESDSQAVVRRGQTGDVEVRLDDADGVAFVGKAV